MATIIEDWTFYGFYFQKSDSSYGIIQEAIKSNNVNQSYLQEKLGHRAPIIVDHTRKTVEFCMW